MAQPLVGLEPPPQGTYLLGRQLPWPPSLLCQSPLRHLIIVIIIIIIITLSSSCELGRCRASLVFPEQSILCSSYNDNDVDVNEKHNIGILKTIPDIFAQHVYMVCTKYMLCMELLIYVYIYYSYSIMTILMKFLSGVLLRAMVSKIS